MDLSLHFTLEELVAHPHRGIDNTPTEANVVNLRLLCGQILDPSWTLLGPLHVTSGYRCPELNRLVGGQVRSQHLDGLAADVTPRRKSIAVAAELLLASEIPFDQLIVEYGSWLHLSRARPGRQPRREALMIGKWSGGKYAPLDLSVIG